MIPLPQGLVSRVTEDCSHPLATWQFLRRLYFLLRMVRKSLSCFFFFFSGQPCADRDFLKETFFLKQPLGSSELSPPRGMSALPIYGCFRMFSDHQLLLMPTGLHVFLNNPYLVYFAESLRVKEDPVLKQNTKELPIPLMPFICCLSH